MDSPIVIGALGGAAFQYYMKANFVSGVTHRLRGGMDFDFHSPIISGALAGGVGAWGADQLMPGQGMVGALVGAAVGVILFDKFLMS